MDEISKLENMLSKIEEQRALHLTTQSTKLMEDLKALNYQPPATIDRMLQVYKNI